MTKLRRISDLQHEFSFLNPSDNFDVYFDQFLSSDLGKIYTAIPWEELVSVFKIKESIKGTKNYFSPKGKLALMFLKHYACCSDKRLIEQLNANIDYQFFCDIHLGHHRLTNYKIVSQIRCELSRKLNIPRTEKVLFNNWSRFIKDQHCITVDATCYESEVRYPTDQKLLWESVHWTYHQMKILCKLLKIKLPRTKYIKWKKRYIGYSKTRKKTYKNRRKLTRSLLWLLEKVNNELDIIEKQYDFSMTELYYKRREIIKKVQRQQKQYFKTGKPPKDRIVSISKSYLRPIVRGKEIKRVEFGAKVNKFQINGINFIEHISFNAFNEGIRFKNTIYKAQGLTKTRVKIAGADAIYATNKNRVFATNNKIQTDFKPKGRPSKHRKQQIQLAKLITKERATRLEGSFGKEKEHYHLKKVKAKTLKTEILWIFFGIHTANALEIGRRMQLKSSKKAA
ncbi:MAG: transposase [Bacteroidota bacterium]